MDREYDFYGNEIPKRRVRLSDLSPFFIGATFYYYRNREKERNGYTLPSESKLAFFGLMAWGKVSSLAAIGYVVWSGLEALAQ